MGRWTDVALYRANAPTTNSGYGAVLYVCVSECEDWGCRQYDEWKVLLYVPITVGTASEQGVGQDSLGH